MNALRSLVVLTAVFALAGCASGDPGGAATGLPAQPSQTAGGEEVDVEAAWLDGGRMVGVVTWGSSSCVPSAGEVAYVDGVLEVALTGEFDACTDDLAPRATLVPLPAEVDPSRDLAVMVIGDGYEGSAELDGVPGLAPDGETDYAPSAGFTHVDGQIVLLTWGSSSCVPTVLDATATSETTARVIFATPPDDQVCTMDMGPRSLVLQIDGLEHDGVVLSLEGDLSVAGEVAVLPY